MTGNRSSVIKLGYGKEVDELDREQKNSRQIYDILIEKYKGKIIPSEKSIQRYLKNREVIMSDSSIAIPENVLLVIDTLQDYFNQYEQQIFHIYQDRNITQRGRKLAIIPRKVFLDRLDIIKEVIIADISEIREKRDWIFGDYDEKVIQSAIICGECRNNVNKKKKAYAEKLIEEGYLDRDYP